jgi:hypothetical protein
MSTHKPLPDNHPHNQATPKAVQPSEKRFRHRDRGRGIHTGNIKGNL